MSAHAMVVWAGLAAWLIVAILIVVQLVRAFRELSRMQRRAEGYADLPVMRAADRAEADLARVEAALSRLEPLLARAQIAVTIIRRGPIPPAASNALRRVRAEFAAFRASAAR